MENKNEGRVRVQKETGEQTSETSWHRRATLVCNSAVAFTSKRKFLLVRSQRDNGEKATHSGFNNKLGPNAVLLSHDPKRREKENTPKFLKQQ